MGSARALDAAARRSRSSARKSVYWGMFLSRSPSLRVDAREAGEVGTGQSMDGGDARGCVVVGSAGVGAARGRGWDAPLESSRAVAEQGAGGDARDAGPRYVTLARHLGAIPRARPQWRSAPRQQQPEPRRWKSEKVTGLGFNLLSTWWFQLGFNLVSTFGFQLGFNWFQPHRPHCRDSRYRGDKASRRNGPARHSRAVALHPPCRPSRPRSSRSRPAPRAARVLRGRRRRSPRATACGARCRNWRNPPRS